MPADIVGTQVLEEDEHGHRSFTFRPGPVFASFVLADEVNRASPKTQSALLEAMQERAVTAGGSTRPLPRPFLVMATQNPLEMEGTYPLPEAQLDRFLLKALVPFPSADDLVTVLERTTGPPTDQPDRVADAPTLLAMIDLTRRVPDRQPRAAPRRRPRRRHPAGRTGQPGRRCARYVRFGASPRGAQALVLAAKVRALLDGRPERGRRRRPGRRPGGPAPPARRRLRGGRRRRDRRRRSSTSSSTPCRPRRRRARSPG